MNSINLFHYIRTINLQIMETIFYMQIAHFVKAKYHQRGNCFQVTAVCTMPLSVNMQNIFNTPCPRPQVI